MIQVDRGKDFEVLVAGFDMYVKNSSDSVSLIYLSSGGYSTWRQKGKTTGYPHTRILFFKNTCHQFCSTSVHGDFYSYKNFVKPYRPSSHLGARQFGLRKNILLRARLSNSKVRRDKICRHYLSTISSTQCVRYQSHLFSLQRNYACQIRGQPLALLLLCKI